MIDRRTFLKLSAGALVLTAAGAMLCAIVRCSRFRMIPASG